MKANQPAFPIPDFVNGNGDVQPGSIGLTKREYFSSMAMQGLLANPNFCTLTTELVCEAAAQHADALLAELEKEPKQ